MLTSMVLSFLLGPNCAVCLEQNQVNGLVPIVPLLILHAKNKCLPENIRPVTAVTQVVSGQDSVIFNFK